MITRLYSTGAASAQYPFVGFDCLCVVLVYISHEKIVVAEKIRL